MLGFMVVAAVLVVSLGRVGDMFGRVRMYNLGFAIVTVASILLSATWMQGSSSALWLIVLRIVLGIGAAFLFANSSAILTDAFPTDQRGMALGINMVAADRGIVHRARARRRAGATATYLTGHTFFPSLVSQPFASGIHAAFYFAAGCCALAAVASWLRGGRYVHGEVAEPVIRDVELAEAA